MSEAKIVSADDTILGALIDLAMCPKEEIPKILNARFEIEEILQGKKIPCKKVTLQKERLQIVVGQNEFCFYWGEKNPKKNSVFLLRINNSPTRCIWGEDEKDWNDYKLFLKMDNEQKEVFLRAYFEKYAKIKIPYPNPAPPCPWTVPATTTTTSTSGQPAIHGQ
ncbi:MAG: hypothetical protein Q7T79_01915 [bacterium]|nr:hypothetical protein [bacterium]